MYTIYLAGPMDAVTKEQQTGWRETCKMLVHDHDIKVLDPCRRSHEDDLTHREIFELDMLDVEECDLIVADCRDYKKPTFGTPCEIFYASYILKKPVIGWYDFEYKPTNIRVFQDALLTREFDNLYLAVDHVLDFYYAR